MVDIRILFYENSRTVNRQSKERFVLKKAFAMKAQDLARMRKDSGMDQEQLAFLLYRDPKKRQRIGKIERGELQPTFFEGLSWFKHCAVGVDREDVINAIKVLERASQKN